MDENVIRPNGRVVVHELLPARAPIQRYKQAELRANVEQIAILGVFANHLQISVARQVRRNAAECLPVVVRNERIRLEVIAAVAVHGDVRRARVEMRRVNAGDPMSVVRGETGKILAHLRERGAIVAAHLHESVIGTGPYDAGHHG